MDGLRILTFVYFCDIMKMYDIASLAREEAMTMEKYNSEVLKLAKKSRRFSEKELAVLREDWDLNTFVPALDLRPVETRLLSLSYLPVEDKLRLIERSLKELDLHENYTLSNYLPGIDSRHEFAQYMSVLRRIRKQLNNQHKWARKLAQVAWEQAK